MLLEEYIPLFLDILSQFIDINVKDVVKNLTEKSTVKNEEPIIVEYYCHPNVFCTESQIKPETNKKKYSSKN